MRVSPGQPIQIAFIGDLSGANPTVTEQLLNAARLAAEDLGKVSGFTVEILPFDDQCQVEAAQVAKDQVLANHQVTAIIGLSCPRTAEQELAYFDSAHIAVLASGVTQPGMQAYAPNVWNSTVLDDNQTAAVSGFFKVNDQPAYQPFATRYEARFGKDLGEAGPSAAATYDSVQILAKVIEASSWVDSTGTLVIGRQALLQTVRATRAFEGTSGYITLDESGRRTPPVAPDAWGQVIVKPGEKIQLAVLEPDLEPFKSVISTAAALAIQNNGPLSGFEIEIVAFDACAMIRKGPHPPLR